MTNGQKFAASYALAVPLVIGFYFLSGHRGNPDFTRSYFGTIGIGMVCGLIGYLCTPRELRRNDA